MRKKTKALGLIDRPIFNYWQALYLSCFSSRLYVDVVKRWKGYGVLYLLLVVAIGAIPISVRVLMNFNQFYNEQMIEPIEKLPILYIQNGEVTFDKPMPYLVKNKKDEVVAIVDTKGTVTGMSSSYPQMTLLITANQIIFRPPQLQLLNYKPSQNQGEKIYAQPLHKSNNEVFDGKVWVKTSGVMTLKYVTELLIYPLITAFSITIYAVVMLIFSLLAQVVAQVIFHVKLKYKESCRLFLVASTVQILVTSVMFALNITFPGSGLLYLILLSAYYSYAVISVRRERKQLVIR